VFFAEVGIEGADVAIGVDQQLNGGIGHFEEPRLGVVWAGG
jgi:hypothetical protein